MKLKIERNLLFGDPHAPARAALLVEAALVGGRAAEAHVGRGPEPAAGAAQRDVARVGPHSEELIIQVTLGAKSELGSRFFFFFDTCWSAVT